MIGLTARHVIINHALQLAAGAQGRQEIPEVHVCMYVCGTGTERSGGSERCARGIITRRASSPRLLPLIQRMLNRFDS